MLFMKVVGLAARRARSRTRLLHRAGKMVSRLHSAHKREVPGSVPGDRQSLNKIKSIPPLSLLTLQYKKVPACYSTATDRRRLGDSDNFRYVYLQIISSSL